MFKSAFAVLTATALCLVAPLSPAEAATGDLCHIDEPTISYSHLDLQTYFVHGDGKAYCFPPATPTKMTLEVQKQRYFGLSYSTVKTSLPVNYTNTHHDIVGQVTYRCPTGSSGYYRIKVNVTGTTGSRTATGHAYSDAVKIRC